MTKPMTPEQEQATADKRAAAKAAAGKLAAKPAAEKDTSKDKTTERRFTSIARKWGREGVKVAWKTCCPDGKWVLASSDDPHPATGEFNEAFDALQCHLTGPMGMNDTQRQGLRVLCVKLFWTKDGAYNVVLTAARPLCGYEGPALYGLPKQKPSATLEVLIEALAGRATAYLNGEKGQLELQLEEGE